ncbi:MAG: EAL domain-containing protein [Mobilicoccus sp.]|nr:EAL domain-containing protein [Mobilicoccus sp.]
MARQVETFFQPFYNLRTRRLQGFEALARLRDADGRPQVPAAFFSSMGMPDLDRQVLDASLAQLGARERAGHDLRDLVLSINLSVDFLSSRYVINDVLGALQSHSLPGHRVLVDLPTDDFRTVQGESEVVANLRALQDHEIAVCIDSFTSGDLDLLEGAAAVPVDVIKLHPGVVEADDERGRDVFCRLADTVQEHGFPVVAAGVETEAELALAHEVGVEWVQGFLLGAPVEAQEAFDYPPELASD